MNKKIVLKSQQIINSSTLPSGLLSLLATNRNITNLAEFLTPPAPNATPADFAISPEVFSAFISHLKSYRDKNILIYGDYDADGVCSTALLYLSLSKYFKNLLPFTPHREKDGYGIKASSVFRFAKEKSFQPDLVITIDNGISAKKEIKKLQESGIEVMIIDHHMSGGAVPDVKYILHSTVSSASALAWLVARQFDDTSRLELATVGVVSDCMPLIGINRSIVVHGLPFFTKSRNFGIQALINSSGLAAKAIGVYDIAYSLAPRLNASGRLDDPTDALRLLCSPTETLAAKYSERLGQLNTDRQVVQTEALESIETLIDTSKKILFVYKPDLHPGVIGLIAGKLTEKYYKPSIVVTRVDGICKGSCRSIPELHITACLEEVRHLCIDLGGHALAAGFSIEEVNIPEFTKKIHHIVKSKLVNIILEPKLIVDAKMDISAVTLENIKAIDSLSPFGIENTEPLFLFENAIVRSKNILGKDGKHLKLVLDNNLEALRFSASEKDFALKIGDSICFVAKLGANTWNNTTKPQLIIKSIN